MGNLTLSEQRLSCYPLCLVVPPQHNARNVAFISSNVLAAQSAALQDTSTIHMNLKLQQGAYPTSPPGFAGAGCISGRVRQSWPERQLSDCIVHFEQG